MIKKFAVSLIMAVGLRFVLVSFHRWRLTAAMKDMERFGTETTMPVWCSERFQRHQQALCRLGFMTQREFALQHRRISDPAAYRAFWQLMRLRFPDGYWSCAAKDSQIIVTAPTSQMSEWRQFVVDYDRNG